MADCNGEWHYVNPLPSRARGVIMPVGRPRNFSARLVSSSSPKQTENMPCEYKQYTILIVPAQGRSANLQYVIVFSTSAELKHRTPIPKSVSHEKLLQCIHNHDILIHLDPEYHSHETLETPPDATSPETKCYRVTDHMHNLPAGLWDSTVSFTSEITNIDAGVEWVIKAPLGLLQKTYWRIMTAEPSDKVDGETVDWVLVEDVSIECSRLLMGTIKSKCEGNWRGIHQTFIERVAAWEPPTAKVAN